LNERGKPGYNVSVQRRFLLAGALAACALAPAQASEDDAWAALSRGAIALVRHADAPGTGDPPGWKLDDCSTQRNLSAAGRADARALGEALRNRRIPITRVLSSPWCRCIDTARLMDVGRVQTEPAFSNAFVLNDRREELTAGALTVLRGWKGPGTLLVVSHGSNIMALTGRNPSSGEAVVVSLDAQGALRVEGTLLVRSR
jgi:phosphohistidine phosphatase SixA